MYCDLQPSLLLIGIAPCRRRTAAAGIHIARTLREAIALLRIIRFDLLVIGLDDPKLGVWDLVHRVLAAWSQQRWILASSRVTTKDEVLARSRGALLVLHLLPDDQWLLEFAASLRRRDRSITV